MLFRSLNAKLALVHKENVKSTADPEEYEWSFSKRKDDRVFDDEEIERIPQFYQQQVFSSDDDTDTEEVTSREHKYLRKLVEK